MSFTLMKGADEVWFLVLPVYNNVNVLVGLNVVSGMQNMYMCIGIYIKNGKHLYVQNILL